MTKRIFRSICLAAGAVFLASLILIMGMLYSYFSRVQRTQLRTQTALAACGVENLGADYFDGLDLPSNRVTWISPDGTVLYDSQADARDMENHLQREEIQQALSTGWGESQRWSVTLLERSLYAAKRLEDGSVLRFSTSQNSVLTLLLGMSQPIVIVCFLALILSIVLAMRLSRRIVAPLNELDLDDPAENECYEELTPLLRRIRGQQKELQLQADRLRQKQNELTAVTGSMREGMVLLNKSGMILSINPAACALLDTDRRCVGRDLLTVNRNLELQAVLSKALDGTAAERTIPLHDRRFQVDASPVVSGGEVSGAVLLLIDVTEKEQAETMRREFTANVSHELRTPLTSISGCGELLKSGLVKPEDVASFGENIYSEAQRMVRLVDDIISLSHLDEGAEDLKRERVDLYAIAQTAVQSLAGRAEAAGVTLELTGRPTPMEGIPQLLGEIAANLCDNAIKYNRPGGWVRVSVESGKDAVRLTVADSGIGIPQEHQAHIFERFYRGDKSRSKAVSGTGLGLSIVKHAVQIHGGKIDLSSAPGRGTAIAVSFPIEQAKNRTFG